MTTYAVCAGPITVTANQIKTLILLGAAVSVPDRLCEVHASFDGQAAGPGIGVELVRTTTLGNPVGTAATPVRDSSPLGSTSTATALTDLTTEPTAYEVLRSWFVAPFGGILVVPFTPLREPATVNLDRRLGLRVVAPATVASGLRARASIVVEE